MGSIQRVRTTLQHKNSDKISIDFGATDGTGISVSLVSKLRDHYGLSNKNLVKIVKPS